MEKDRLKQQFDFLLEADKEKSIGRQTYISDGTRKENDAEHAWHLALMAVLLNEYSNDKIDVLKTITMLLTHDLVEIYAGDTYAYDETANESKRQRETVAADRLYGLLPEDQRLELCSLWEEFEQASTPEAKFAHTLDNIQPLMLNASTDWKSWVEHCVKIEQVFHRNQNTDKGSETLWKYAKENFIDKGRSKL